MGAANAPPVARGQTYYGIAGTIPTAAQSKGLEGQTAVFENLETVVEMNVGSRNKQALRSNGDVHAILVRNSSGISLYPGQAVTWSVRGRSVAGYCRVTAEEVAGIVDDHLIKGSTLLAATPRTPVRDGDLFWLIVKGQCLVCTTLTAIEARAAGDALVALTADATMATIAGTTSTAGRVDIWDGDFAVTATTDGLSRGYLFNRIGRAISACGSTSTNQPFLVDVNIVT